MAHRHVRGTMCPAIIRWSRPLTRLGVENEKSKFQFSTFPQNEKSKLQNFRISVVQHIRARSKTPMRIFVLCETLTNPACEFFSQLAALDQNIRVRTGSSLIEDIRLFLCASEVAASHGTFQLVLPLSKKISVRHTFVLNKPGSPLSPPDEVDGFPRLNPVRIVDAQGSLSKVVSHHLSSHADQRFHLNATDVTTEKFRLPTASGGHVVED